MHKHVKTCKHTIHVQEKTATYQRHTCKLYTKAHSVNTDQTEVLSERYSTLVLSERYSQTKLYYFEYKH